MLSTDLVSRALRDKVFADSASPACTAIAGHYSGQSLAAVQKAAYMLTCLLCSQLALLCFALQEHHPASGGRV